MFSPINADVTKRYEDFENIYDYIVEQEELRRLKREKLLKKKIQQNNLIISGYSSNSNNSSVGFDELDEDSDDFSIDDTHELIDPRDDLGYNGYAPIEESCLINQTGS